MTKLEALRTLLWKVETGDFFGPPYLRGLEGHTQEREMLIESGMYDFAYQIRNTYNGSLDAAKALHEAVLEADDPQYGYMVGPAYARIVHPSCGTIVGEGQSMNNPASAWLIAILRALIAEEEAKA